MDAQEGHHVGFVRGKAILSPLPEHSIPILELRTAALAVEIAGMVVSELDAELDAVNLYTDSKIVLGFIHNKSR